MYTPFNRVPGPCYAGVPHCTIITVRKLNDATKLAAGQAGGCSICNDTLGEDGVSAKLAMTTLPDCNHSFHEYCLMQWLNSIILPPTAGADSALEAPSEAASSTDIGNILPQQITPDTQDFVQEVAAAIQHIMDGRDGFSGAEEHSQKSRFGKPSE